MEELCKPSYFDTTEHIKLKEYFEKYSAKLFKGQKSSEQSTDSVNDNIFSFMNSVDVDSKFRKEMIKACDVSNLSVAGEKQSVDFVKMGGITDLECHYEPWDVNEKALQLATVRNLEARNENANLRSAFQKDLEDFQCQETEVHVEGNGPADLIPGKDFVIYLRFFRPSVYVYENQRGIKMDYDVAVLGSNTLADLRDIIRCVSNFTLFQEVSDHPDLEQLKQQPEAQEVYPSGFIFIDDTFYNDFRKPDAIDYSRVIREWALRKKIGEFSTAEMSTTCLEDLSPRFGYPYIYQHHGLCEHIFMFTHAKLLGAEDLLQKKFYPRFTSVTASKATICSMCGQMGAQWLVTECERVPLARAPLCDDCFQSYCYVDGEKVGSFKAYPFVYRNVLI